MASLQPFIVRAHRVRLRLGAKVDPIRQQLSARWRALSPREHRQTGLMLAVLTGALLWLLLIKPALNTLDHWQQELPRLRSQQAALQTLLGQATATDSAAPTTLLQRINASLDLAGLRGDSRVTPAGAEMVVTFAQPVDAARLITWLLNTSTTPGMTVQQVRIDRAGAGENAPETATRVSASVTLAAQ
ncbi:MAG TPA: type II secretion system protein GspM [Enterobacteriaceae bacterium]|nr:type II secretion system protein GspM [Enterobacteriaceae bacterium]